MTNYDTPPPVPPMAATFNPGGTRPGLVTAIGIVSILLAAWFILMSVLMVIHMTIMGFMAAMPVATPVIPTTVPTTAPTTNATVVITTNVPMTMTTIDMRPETPTVIWLSSTSLANVLLSIVLLWAGIATLRNRRSGRTLHRFWAIAKIVLLPLLIYAEFLYMGQMFGSVMQALPAGQPAPTQMFDVMSAVGAGFNAVFALIYPVMLLILLRTQSVRRFFEEQTI